MKSFRTGGEIQRGRENKAVCKHQASTVNILKGMLYTEEKEFQLQEHRKNKSQERKSSIKKELEGNLSIPAQENSELLC